MSVASTLGAFCGQFIVGGTAGYILGRVAVWIINKINLNNVSLYPLLLLSIVFFVYTFTYLLNGNGYLAVYIAGIIVGNAKIVHRKEISGFLDGMTWLFQIIMFLALGLLVNPHEMFSVALIALLIGIFMIILARPLSVLICLLPYKTSQINYRSRMFISWVGLRGAVPIIFATYPVVAKIEGANQIFNIVFFITILSLLMQGTSLSRVARLLRLDVPLPETGNSFGIELPEETNSSLHDLILTEEMLINSNRLMDMNLPKGTLVMMVSRGDEYISFARGRCLVVNSQRIARGINSFFLELPTIKDFAIICQLYPKMEKS